LESAHILAGNLGISLIVEPALREYDCGELEGRGDPQAWEIHQTFVRDWFAGRRLGECPPGGETFFDIQARLRGMALRLLGEFGGKDAQVLCVSHGGTLALGLPGLLQNVSMEFARKNMPGHLDIIQAEHTRQGWRCLSWGDTTFAEP
jgi:probable phosphoglycerate mutase